MELGWEVLNPAAWFAVPSEQPVNRQATSNWKMPLAASEYETLNPASTARWFTVWQQLKERLSFVEKEFAQFDAQVAPTLTEAIVRRVAEFDELPALEAELKHRYPDEDPAERHRKALTEAVSNLNRARSEGPFRKDKFESIGLTYLIRRYRSFDLEAIRRDIEPLVGDVVEHKEERTRQLARVATAKRNLASHLKEVTGCFIAELPKVFNDVRIDPDNHQQVADSIISSFVRDWRSAAKFHGCPVTVNGSEIATLPYPVDWRAGYEELSLGQIAKQPHLFKPRNAKYGYDSEVAHA